jgi:hypothetical protein
MEVTTCHKNKHFINIVHEYHHEMHHKQFLPDLPIYCSNQLPIKLCTMYSQLVSQYHYLVQQSTDLTHAHKN